MLTTAARKNHKAHLSICLLLICACRQTRGVVPRSAFVCGGVEDGIPRIIHDLTNDR